MTREGQALIQQAWASDMDLFPETETHKEVAQLEAERGKKFERVDVAWYAAHPEAYEAWKQISKIFTSKQ